MTSSVGGPSASYAPTVHELVDDDATAHAALHHEHPL